MKNISFLLFAICLVIASCGDDRDAQIVLSNDGANLTSPNLPTDTYELATQFTAAEVAPFAGQVLSEVDYFMADTPLSTSLKIYGEADGSQPGALLYQCSLTGSINTDDWNTHVLSTPITLTGEEIWISIRARLPRTQQSVGCDAGPAVAGGDWVFQESDGLWQTFQARTGESINWNIRGVVEE